MTHRSIALALLGLVVGAGHLFGQDKKEKTRSFTADFGFVSAAGNTSVTTFNIGDKFVVNSADKKVVFTQVFSAVRSEADGVKNAENFRGQLRLDYGVGHRFYLFGLTGWERNRPAGIARRFEDTLGLSFKAVSQPQDELNFEFGLSLFQQKNTEAINGQLLNDDYMAGRLAGAYKHIFNASTILTQQLELIPNFDDSDDFRLNSESALVAPISTHIAVKLGYVIRYDNLPSLLPAPNPALDRFKKTDRFLTAGLTISY